MSVEGTWVTTLGHGYPVRMSSAHRRGRCSRGAGYCRIVRHPVAMTSQGVIEYVAAGAPRSRPQPAAARRAGAAQRVHRAEPRVGDPLGQAGELRLQGINLAVSN